MPRSARFAPWCALSLSVFCFDAAFADQAGTTAANFLKIPAAPIPAALGQAYTALSGVDSIAYNPAGIGFINYTSLSAAHNEYVENIKQEYAAVAMGTRYGTFGAAFTSLNSGAIDAYDENGSPSGDTSSSHLMAVLSYARSFPRFKTEHAKIDRMLITPDWPGLKESTVYRPQSMRLAVGANVKYLRERLDDTSSSALSCDLGVLAVPYPHFQIGASLLNIFGSQKFENSSASLPRTLRFGLAKDFIASKKAVILKTAADVIKETDRDVYYAAGAETAIMELFQLRIGYRTKQDLGTGLSAGIGISLDRLTDEEFLIKGARIDYAYINQGAFNASHRIGLQLLFP